MAYSMMTCTGWGAEGFKLFGACTMSWLSFAIILFLALIAKRQCTDGFLAGTGFNIIGAFIFGLGRNFLVTTLTGSARWSLIAGIAGVVIGGYVFGLFADQTDSGGDY